MKDLIIGDCHFGVKTNSAFWLEQQLKLFNNEIMTILSEHDFSRVIFLGDLFDIRYAINQQVGYDVKKLVRDLSNRFPDIAFYFVAGNHDYYSPDIKYESYNAYNLVFGYEFEEIHGNVHFIHDNYLYEDFTLFAPWYWTEDEERFKRMMKDLEGEEIKVMYCHSDLPTWFDGTRATTIKKFDCHIISGHIHYIQTNEAYKMYNVGAAMPLDFNDVNQERMVYMFETDTQKFEGHFVNDVTPRFVQFRDEEIFKMKPEDTKNNYVRLYISSDNVNKALYIEKLSEIKKNYEYVMMKVVTVETNFESAEFGGKEFETNIDEYIEANIPEYLKPKYDRVKEIITNTENQK